MDYSIGGGSESGEEVNGNFRDDGEKSSHKRLTSAQTSILKNFMKECHHPDEAERHQLAVEVGLEPKQIKFWFQNKRTLLKHQHERETNGTLRRENDKIRNENLKIKECEKMSSLLASYMEKKISRPEFEQALKSIKSFSRDYECSSHVHGNLATWGGVLGQTSTQNYDAQKITMSQVVDAAMDELVRLVRVNEPFWVKSPNTQDGYTFHRESYEQVFPKNNHFKGANVCEESSKYSGLVKISGIDLVGMFLDSVKWTNLFPTIVTKAETIKVFEIGSPGSRDGALLLMNEEMHILSPLVRPREFNIIRYCKKFDAGVWVIADVSFDSSRPNTAPLSRGWKHPSGCIIREMPHGGCLVTWVEHVEVEDKIHTHYVYRDLVGNYNLYGAESWIKELQRMCERSLGSYVEAIPVEETIGVIQTLEGRNSVIKLAQRMVKMFCESLTMPGQLELNHLTLASIGGIRVSFRSTTDDDTSQPNGTIVTAATTLWLPLPALKVFEFLKDPTKRSQWDGLSCGNPMHEIAHISNGPYHGNCISIIKPFIPTQRQMMILQESFTSRVGSYIIYAPSDRQTMDVALRGEDSKELPILPYGFVVCSKSQPNLNAPFGASNNIEDGSLLTLAAQILSTSPHEIDQVLNVEDITDINTHLATTILNVKDALMSSI
ncbi:homeobox-leucine zipper protein HDG11 [Medicago truncatula]|uniref:homeobox-leucine zipper protein HDG11 n=1 Tax=Medicago truncatula TaxID=3880 RepID=UPI000D2F3C12|nr:homeobox-leucine zipper protein HDG11 [Medicago truncatula]